MALEVPATIDTAWVLNQLIPLLEDSSHKPPVDLSERLCATSVVNLLDSVCDILKSEPTLLELGPKSPGERYIVFGDTHGQFHDVVNMLRQLTPEDPQTNFVFNGDYVDRGMWGLEILLTLAALKLAVPERVSILRGNHESSDCIRNYGFEMEVQTKYPQDHKAVLKSCRSLFAALPLAATIASATLVLHGGLFRHPTSSSYTGKRTRGAAAGKHSMQVGDLGQLRRAFKGGIDPDGTKPRTVVATDVLWSDPMKEAGMRENHERGVGIVFGPDVTQEFLQHNNLKLIIRSHEGPDARKMRTEMPSMASGWTVDHVVTGKLKRAS